MTRIALLLLGPVGLVSCSGPPLPGQVELEGMSVRTVRSEVLAALPGGPRAEGEGVIQGYRLDSYFVEGNWVEVVWLEPVEGVAAGMDPRQSVNPVIFLSGGLDGWGWDHFDDRAQEWGIQPFEPEEVEPATEPAEGAPTEPSGTTVRTG